MTNPAMEETTHEKILELYVKSKTRSLRISSVILILTGIAYTVAAVMLELAFLGPLAILTGIVVLMEVAVKVLKYRHKNGLLGNNEAEARALIAFVLTLAKNKDSE